MAQTILTGWEEKTLGEICVIIAGQSPNSQFYNTEANGLPFYQGKKEFTNKYIGTPSVWTTETTKEALPGDILMSVRAPVGPINYATERCCIGRGLASIRNGELISKDFLFYYLLSIQQKIGGHDGAVFNSISRNEISALKILLPSLSEQERIVAKLDEAFEAIDKVKANAEQNLNNAKELFESALNNVFTKNTDGWEEKTLGSISDLKQNKAEVKNIDANTLVSFVPMEYLGINQKYFNSNQFKPIKNLIKSYTYFAENDVIMAKITPCFENGKIGIAKGLMNKIGFGSSEYIVFRTNKDINSEYLYYFLNRETFRKEGAQNMLGAVGHKRVSKEFIENYPFSYPSLSEQQKIVEKLDALQEQTKKLEQIYTQKIKECDELKQSILQKAFRGEL